MQSMERISFSKSDLLRQPCTAFCKQKWTNLEAVMEGKLMWRQASLAKGKLKGKMNKVEVALQAF